MNNRAEDIQSKIKSWLFPSLVTVLTALIWKDITELKADVKALLAQSNIDKTRIDNLEREVYNKKVAYTTVLITSSPKKENKNKGLFYNREIAIVESTGKRKLSIALKKSKNEV